MMAVYVINKEGDGSIIGMGREEPIAIQSPRANDTWPGEAILAELKAIREILEFQKEWMLQRRAEMKAEEEADKAERERQEEEGKAYLMAVSDQTLKKAKQNALDAYRQAAREHEERYHGRPKEKPEVVQ